MIAEEKRPLKDGLPPIHPGELLAEDIAEMKMSPCEFDAALSLCPGATALLLDECSDGYAGTGVAPGALFRHYGAVLVGLAV